MVAISRPNRDALGKAIDIFRDEMRPFFIRSLSRTPALNVEDAIRQSLQFEHQTINFNRNLEQSGDLESAIDVNQFPRLVENHWRDVFSSRFNGDQTIVGKLRIIREARNEVSHPSTRDLDSKYTQKCLSHIAYVLRKANSPEGKQSVERIKSALNGQSVPRSYVRSEGSQNQERSNYRDSSREVEKSKRPSTRHRASSQARARLEARTKKEAKVGKGENAKKAMIIAALSAALGLVSFLGRKARSGDSHQQ